MAYHPEYTSKNNFLHEVGVCGGGRWYMKDKNNFKMNYAFLNVDKYNTDQSNHSMGLMTSIKSSDCRSHLSEKQGGKICVRLLLQNIPTLIARSNVYWNSCKDLQFYNF